MRDMLIGAEEIDILVNLLRSLVFFIPGRWAFRQSGEIMRAVGLVAMIWGGLELVDALGSLLFALR